MRTRLSVALVAVLLVAAGGNPTDTGEMRADFPSDSEWTMVRGRHDGVPLGWGRAAFAEAARLAGLQMSGWVRERLRQAARQELEEAGQDVPFLSGKSLD